MVGVLLCEDSRDIRELLHLQLEGFDLRIVGECSSAAECLRAAERLRPDVILLDLGLPGEGGARVASFARLAPVVVFSGYPAYFKERECLDAGAVAYVEKTSRPEVLADALRLAARGR